MTKKREMGCDLIIAGVDLVELTKMLAKRSDDIISGALELKTVREVHKFDHDRVNVLKTTVAAVAQMERQEQLKKNINMINETIDKPKSPF